MTRLMNLPRNTYNRREFINMGSILAAEVRIEAPRSKLRRIFDPQIGILFFMLANPVASHGECARGDST